MEGALGVSLPVPWMQLLGAQRGEACERGLAGCRHKKLFVSGLCPRRRFVGTAAATADLVTGSAWPGQVCLPALDLLLRLSLLHIIDWSLINSTADCLSF